MKPGRISVINSSVEDLRHLQGLPQFLRKHLVPSLESDLLCAMRTPTEFQRVAVPNAQNNIAFTLEWFFGSRNLKSSPVGMSF